VIEADALLEVPDGVLDLGMATRNVFFRRLIRETADGR
jgi:hypothetical protein